MTPTTTQSREWLNSNTSRAYPLDDLTGGVPGTLPCNALVDGFVLTTGFTDGDYIFYISKSENTGKSIILSVTAEDLRSGNTVVFDGAVSIQNVEDYGTVEFFAISEDQAPKTISGAFTVGSKSAIQAMPTAEYTSAQCMLAPYVIRAVDRLCVTGIRVGDTVLTGEVTIEAGSGVDINADPATGTITISASEYSPPPENMNVTTDGELSAQLLDTYGRPVTSIAGALPDADGNISINTLVDVDNNYYIIPERGDVDGVLILRLNRDPRISADFIESLLANTNQLDARIGKVDSTITAVDRVIGSVATQMTRLG